MSVKLRLTRMGRKKRPFYRIVATDSRTRRDGKYLEKIGTYNPLESPALVDIDKELALKWLLNGAQPSTTVKNLLKKDGILFEFDLRKRGLTEEQIELEYKKWEVVKQERQKKAEAMAEMKRREEEKKAEEEAKAKAKAEAEAKAKEEAEAAAAAAEAEAEAAEETEEAADEAPAEDAEASVEEVAEEAPAEGAPAEEATEETSEEEEEKAE